MTTMLVFADSVSSSTVTQVAAYGVCTVVGTVSIVDCTFIYVCEIKQLGPMTMIKYNIILTCLVKCMRGEV